MIQKVVLVDSFAPVIPYDEDKERDNKLNRLLGSMNLKGVEKGGLSLDAFASWVCEKQKNMKSTTTLDSATWFVNLFAVNFGDSVMKAAWNILGECLFHCGCLHPELRCATYYFYMELAKMKYGWESLLSEVGNEASGPTLCVDFTDMEKWIHKEGRGA
jgi:hypothetical protein